MRTAKEIDEVLKAIAEQYMDNPRSEDIANTLAWVLGDEYTPIEILENTEDD